MSMGQDLKDVAERVGTETRPTVWVVGYDDSYFEAFEIARKGSQVVVEQKGGTLIIADAKKVFKTPLEAITTAMNAECGKAEYHRKRQQNLIDAGMKEAAKRD